MLSKTFLDTFVDAYYFSGRDIKVATVVVRQQPCRSLIEFFGEDKSLADITA